MKKLLTFLLTALLTFTVSWAGTETITFSEQGYTNQQAITTVNGSNFTLTFDKGSNSNDPKYYTSGTAIRVYGGNSMTVTSTKTITKVEITFGSGDGSNVITANVGSYSNGTWTGSATSVTFTVGGTSGNRRFSAVTVTYSDGGTTPLELTLNPATGTAECGESINVDVTANTTLNVVYDYTVSPATGATVTATDGGFSITATTPGTYTVTVSALDDIDREATTTGTYTFTQTGGETTGTIYEKVTSTDGLTSGDYLIVYEGENVAFDGSLTSLDAANNTKSVAIANNKIETNEAIYFTYNKTAGTLKSASGYFIGKTANSNGLDANTSTAYTNTLSIDDNGNAVITASGNCILRYNSDSGQKRFRYYKSGQQPIQLYKRASTDPTLSVSESTLALEDIPYDGTSTSGTFNVTGAHLTGTTVTVSVTGEGFSVQPTSINVVDGTVDQQVTVTYSGTSTTEVLATVTVTCGDLTQEVIVSAKKATPPPATLAASPTSLTISDSGNGNTFNVTGSYLGTDDVGVTVPQGSQFSTTTSDKTWGFENNNGSVSGTVTVTYGGRDLAASETVTIANNQTSTTVNVNYVTDLYVVGNYGNGWNFADSQQMTYSNGTYTTTVNAPAGSYILFARTTGVSYGWEDDANRLFVGAVTDGGDWKYGTYTSGTLDTDPTNDNPVKYHPIYFADAATYVITIDVATGTFAITRQEIKSDDFVLVTSTSDITVDDEYVLVYSSVAGLDDHAMSTSYSSSVYGQTTEGFTLENDVVTLSDPTTVNVLTLKDAGNGAFYILAEGNSNDEYYLYHDGSNSNNVLRNANNGETNPYKWNISIDEYGDVVIQNVGSTDRYLQYNASSPRYACYKNSQQNAKLYKRGTVVKVAAPVITPEGGTSNKRFGAFDVTITADQGCTIHYTTDGTAPTASSETYTEPFTLPYGSAPTTVKAIAIDGNGNVSRVTTVVYYWDRVQVAISPASQQVTAPVQVTITPTPSDATVTYTINGGATVTYTEPFTVNVTEANPEAVVVATATKGESTATATVTYTYKRDYVNSVKEFNELVGANETVEFKNPVVVLFDYSQQGNQDYIWIKDHTGYAQLFIQPGFDKNGTNKRLPRYDNGDVIPGGFKVTKRFYTDGDANFWEGFSADNSVDNFGVPQDKALADPEMVKLSELINTPSNYNNRYLYMTKVKITNGNWGYNDNGFYLAADEGGSTLVANNDVVKGYNKFNPWYNTGDTEHDVIVPTDGRYYNVTFIFQKYSTYYEVMPIEFTPWEDNTLRLEELVKTGVQGNTYTISNPLIAAKVTWDDNYKQFAIFAKDDSMSVAKRYPTSDMGSYVIRYEKGDFINSVPQEEYDQSNWIEILIPSSVTNKTANSAAYTAELGALQQQYEGKILPGGTIANGTYLDTLNPTIRVSSLTRELDASAYTPNIYCTANFLMENLDADGANSYRDGYGQYFMMDAKPQEFCKVVWAYMIGTDNYFVAPMQEGDDINGLNFNGSFLADMSLCEDAEITCETQARNCFDPSDDQKYGNEQALYSFNAIVRKNPASPVWSGTSNAPRHIQPKSDGKETVPAYIVYPLNAGANSEIITAVRELSTDKTIDSVRYFNIMGMESEQPFHGINIVVTRYTDGTTSTAKVLR